MKKIIEVKRGTPVPDNAKWLKDSQRYVGEDVDDCGPITTYNPLYEVVDIFEVPLNLTELSEYMNEN